MRANILKTAFILSLLILLTSCEQTPKPKQLLNSSGIGCYSMQSVGDKLDSGVVFYPLEKSTDTNIKCKNMYFAEKMPFSNIPIILITHGWLGKKEDHYHQAQYLARMGMVAMVFTTAQGNNPLANPSWWVDAYQDMLKAVDKENSLALSPIAKKIDLKDISIMGHSMGGGGIFQLIEQDASLKFTTLVPLAPWNSNFGSDKISAPTLVVSGASDSVALPSMQEGYYAKIPESATKVLIKLNSVRHNDFGNQGSKQKHEIIDKYIKDWIKIQVFKVAKSETLYANEKISQLKTSGELVNYKTNLFD